MRRGMGRAGSASGAASRVVPRPVGARVSNTRRCSLSIFSISAGSTACCSSSDQSAGSAAMTSRGTMTRESSVSKTRALSFNASMTAAVPEGSNSTGSNSAPAATSRSSEASSAAVHVASARAREVRRSRRVASGAMPGGSGCVASGR